MVPSGLLVNPGTPSQGSTLHGSGNCRPCAWFWRPGGCQNGQNCGHCHLCPEGELKMRKKNKMALMRLSAVAGSGKAADFTSSFAQPEGSCSGSEQESTAFCSSPEQESLGPKSGSDDEEVIASVIGYLGLEEVEKPSIQEIQSPANPTLSSMLFPDTLPNTPSRQSKAHGEGVCKPCAWFWKPSGCKNAQN